MPSLLYESLSRTLESRSDLLVLLGSLVCGVGSRRGCGEQGDLCKLYIYVQDKGYDHDRGSQKELQRCKNSLDLVGRRGKEERMNESAAHRVAQKDGLGKLPVNW